MDDSESFTSLDDLINSHMSKPDVQASGSENHIDKLIWESVAAGLASTSTSNIGVVQPPTRRFILPSLALGNSMSEASGILAKQVSNTLCAQRLEEQRRKQKEQQSALTALESDDDEEIIDLMKGMALPGELISIKRTPTPEMENIVFTYNDFDMRGSPVIVVPPNAPERPCLLDREPTSFVTGFRRRNRVKCSNVGKAICTRFEESRAIPYSNQTKETIVVRFVFSTKSPDDVINDSIKRPTIQPRIFI